MFYKQVHKLCNAHNIAITRLARKLNLSPSAPNNWKKGTLPKAETIIKIADFFSVSTDYLLVGSDRQSSNPVAVSEHKQTIQELKIDNNTNSDPNDDVNSFEKEIIRIYRSLSLKGKSALMQYAYNLSEVHISEK